MKIKLFLLFILSFSVSWVYSQNDSKPKVSPALSEEAKCMQMAHNLVRYGIQHESALALIQALELYRTYNVHAAQGAAPVDKDSESASSVYSCNPESVRRYAEIFADGDEILLALLDSYKGNFRSPLNGPSVYYGKKIEAYDSATWTFDLKADEPVYIYVGGDGGTDLDVYVYDKSRNLIDKDTNFGDDCLIIFTPQTLGKYSIVVKNEGDSYNVYDFTIK